MERKMLDNLPRVTEDEALELCVHHLQLAAVYFTNVTEDATAMLDEARRIILREDSAAAESAWAGARAFLWESWKCYERMRRARLPVEWDYLHPQDALEAEGGKGGYYFRPEEDDTHPPYVELFGPYQSRVERTNAYNAWVNLHGRWAMPAPWSK